MYKELCFLFDSYPARSVSNATTTVDSGSPPATGSSSGKVKQDGLKEEQLFILK